MGVAADDRHARLSDAQLRADDVHDALIAVTQRVNAQAEFLGIAAQRVDLGAAHDVRDRLLDVNRGSVVILGGDREIGAAHLASCHPQTLECLRTGYFMAQLQIDVEQVRLARSSAHDVVIPDLLAQSSSHGSMMTLLFK